MKIFLSWSGKQSHQLADAFYRWLPFIFQSVKLFFSPADIEAGDRGESRLDAVLQEYEHGIIFLTASNKEAPWIMFESGALAKNLTKARVSPVLFDMTEADLSNNLLRKFQYVHLTKEGVRKLLGDININLGTNALSKEMLETIFEKWWPDLEAKINAVRESAEAPKTKPFDLEPAIEEILSTLRTLARREPFPLTTLSGLLGSPPSWSDTIAPSPPDPRLGLGMYGPTPMQKRYTIQVPKPGDEPEDKYIGPEPEPPKDKKE